MMELLLRASERLAPRNWSREHLLCRAAARGSLALVSHLIDAGADFKRHASVGRQTPLHEAARAGQAEVVAFLLKRGASTEARDARGVTPLHYVVTSGPEIRALAG